MLIEIIGYVATVFLILSMIFSTKSIKGTLLLRGLNGVASFLFVIYGMFMSVYPTVVSNASLLLINCYYIYKIVKEERSEE